MDSQKLPSRFQLWDRVDLNFYEAGRLTDGEVIKVHFAQGKVLYDVGLLVKKSPEGGEHNIYTRLYNVDSVFVKAVGEMD